MVGLGDPLQGLSDLLPGCGESLEMTKTISDCFENVTDARDPENVFVCFLLKLLLDDAR